MRRFCMIAALLLCVTGLFAQKVSFEVSVPRVVAVGEVFRVEYTLGAKPDDFSVADFVGFEVLAGPSTSQGQEISIANGNVTKKVTYTNTYVLQGSAAGKYTIPQATAVVDGKRYTTEAVPIEVVADATGGKGAAAAGGNDGATVKPAAKIAPDDILVRISVNRKDVFKGQPVRATVKLYTRLGMSGIESAKYPAFNGFWTQELNTDNYKWQRESFNNKVYDSRVIREYLLFPQQSGVLHIERMDLTVIAQIVTQNNRRQSLFDDFFSGGPNIEEVRRTVSSPPVEIRVKDLPSGAPVGFSGAVGQFTMSSAMSSTDIAANSSATYTLKISGSGNLPLIQAPKLDLPNSVEQYNVKTTESLKPTSTDMTGYRQFEYPFIPRAEGEIILEPVQFSYFDPEKMRYVTLSSDNYRLMITADSTGSAAGSRGMVSGISKEDLRILDRDIRFIKLGSSGLRTREVLLFGTWWYFGALALILAVFVFLYFYLQKRIRENSNVVMVKNKRANKIALQRLKAASRYLAEDNPRGFYDEMLKALWGYMGDKLNIPVANLTKDNIREQLAEWGIAQEQTERYVDMISQCEYAQYSPAESGTMGELYKDAVGLLSKFEQVLGKKGKRL